jgi:hypothetical protein
LTTRVGPRTKSAALAMQSASAVSPLDHLKLDAPIPETAYQHLNGLKGLRRLDVSNAPLCVELISAVSGHRELKELYLAGVLPGAALRQMTDLPKLETLSLSCAAKDAADLDVLWKLPEIRSLSLYTNLDDDAFQHLSGLANLRNLKVSSFGLKGHGLSHLAGLAKLETLHLPDLTDAGSAELARLPNLRELESDGSRISERGLKALEQCTNLTKLRLGTTRAPNKAVEDLRARLTHIREFVVTGR